MDRPNSAFQNPIFLNAMYGNRWKKFELKEPNCYFQHAPVFQRINNSRFSYAETWRGYADPPIKGNKESIHSIFEAYSKWCHGMSLACEIIRLDPMGELQHLVSSLKNSRIVQGQPVALLETPSDMKGYVSSLPKACQRILSSARKRLSTRIFDANSDYLISAGRLHRSTMQRVQAGEKWALSVDDLKALSSLPEYINIGVFDKQTKNMVSYGGCILENGRLNVLLVANQLGPKAVGASDLLYERIIQEAINSQHSERPIKHIYLGGGRSTQGDDSLLKFKLKFSLGNSKRCAYLALTHDPEALKKISRENSELRPNEPNIKILQDVFFANQVDDL